ncbi:MAG TPA: hypothetical protein VGJ00_09700 [Rhabdochlamydiaceae bacterium]|jgi:hypothetical protein
MSALITNKTTPQSTPASIVGVPSGDALAGLSSMIKTLQKTGKVSEEHLKDALFCYQSIKEFPKEERTDNLMRTVTLATAFLNTKYGHLIK